MEPHPLLFAGRKIDNYSGGQIVVIMIDRWMDRIKDRLLDMLFIQPGWCYTHYYLQVDR